VITWFYSCIVRSCKGCDLGEESFMVIKWSDQQVFQHVVGGVIRGAASASECACVYCSYGNKWGTCGSKSSSVNSLLVLWNEWSCRIVIVEILHSVEGKNVVQGCSNLEIILLGFDCSSLSLPLLLVFIYLPCLYCLSLYMLDISCAQLIYPWDYLLTLVFN